MDFRCPKERDKMKKGLLFLLLLLPIFALAQSPVIISQPYKFQKWVSVKDSLLSDQVISSGTDSSHKVPTTAYLRRYYVGSSSLDSSKFWLTGGTSNLRTNTTINAGVYDLFLGGATTQNSTFLELVAQPDTTSRGAALGSASNIGSNETVIQFSPNGTSWIYKDESNREFSINFGNGGSAIVDQLHKGGLTNAGNFHSYYQTYSLTDKSYVDSVAIASSGNAWLLTGTSFLTGFTSINNDGNTLIIGHSAQAELVISGSDTTNSNVNITSTGGNYTSDIRASAHGTAKVGFSRNSDAAFQGFNFARDTLNNPNNETTFHNGINFKPLQYDPSIDTAKITSNPLAIPNVQWVLAHGASGGSSFYQHVQTNGTSRTQRANLNFLPEFNAVDNSGNNSTDISINTIAQSKITHLSDTLASVLHRADTTTLIPTKPFLAANYVLSTGTPRDLDLGSHSLFADQALVNIVNAQTAVNGGVVGYFSNSDANGNGIQIYSNKKSIELIDYATNITHGTLNHDGSGTFDSNLTAAKFITSGGTSAQYVKGDGTLGTTAIGTVTSIATGNGLTGGTITTTGTLKLDTAIAQTILNLKPAVLAFTNPLYLKLAGGTMSGDIAMGNNSITGADDVTAVNFMSADNFEGNYFGGLKRSSAPSPPSSQSAVWIDNSGNVNIVNSAGTAKGFTFTGATSTDLLTAGGSHIGNSSDNITEGTTNLYYTTSRSALKANVSGQVFSGAISATNLSGTNTGDQTITLTGEATGSGTGSFATTLTNSAVIGKVLTGYVSGVGTVLATDNILQAIQKLNGNISALPTAVTSVTGTTNRITSSGGTTPVIDISSTFEALLGKVASPLSQFATTSSAQLAGVLSDESGSGVVAYTTSPVFTTPNLGTPSTLVGTNISGTAASLTAGTVTTNANLTGPITSSGNATSIASQTGTGTTFAMSVRPSISALTGSLASTITASTPTGTAGTDSVVVKTSLGFRAISPTYYGTGGSAYTFSTGLTNTSGTITNNLLTGLSGGQTIIGGTGITDVLTYKGTTGNGTSTAVAHQWLVGNNGATVAMSLLNNGNFGIGTTSARTRLDVVDNNTTNAFSFQNNNVSGAAGIDYYDNTGTKVAYSGYGNGSNFFPGEYFIGTNSSSIPIVFAPNSTNAITLSGAGVANFPLLTATTTLGLDASKNVVSITNTGTGNAVRQTSASLTTPNINVATATSVNKVAITAPGTSATLTIANGKTLTYNNSITIAGTDATTMTFPSASTNIVGAPNGATNILASTTTTLVAGVKALSITGVTTSSHAYANQLSTGGTVVAGNYQAVCTAGTVTVTAVALAGTTNTLDTSIVNVFVTN